MHINKKLLVIKNQL